MFASLKTIFVSITVTSNIQSYKSRLSTGRENRERSILQYNYSIKQYRPLTEKLVRGDRSKLL